MIQSSSAGHAKAYFADALSKSDYYLNDQELAGKIKGLLAERLGIGGTASKEVFYNLCENIHPVTGDSLTPRTTNDRTTGYDINFHCPKSVSILHILSNDSHILDVFTESVEGTMKDIEADSKTRVRKNGANEDRNTGELVWAEFIHQTARPVPDKDPDPHLHAHCFAFNATFDKEEEIIKAAQWREIKRDMPYYQARFHKRLSDKLIRLGYQVETKDGSFEIKGVPKNVINHFSKRTDQIGRFAKEKGIHDAKALDKLGAVTRSKKQKGLSMQELKKKWIAEMRQVSRILPGEELIPIRNNPIKDRQVSQEVDCVNHAVKDSFERASVMNERRVLEKAYRYSIGSSNISLDDITKAMKEDESLLFIKQGQQQMMTTREVLKEEKRMVDYARNGIGKMNPLYETAPEIKLDDKEQKSAVAHVLTTRDRVSIIRGAAGTGKTTLMKEAVKKIEAAGKKVIVVAPTAQASRGVLKEDGFAQAETVAKLLTSENMKAQLDHQVLWVDEAGLLGTKDMAALLKLATEKNARLILGGDTRQHSSVLRGDALRILNTVGKIKAAEVTNIYRQKMPIYKTAVEDLSNGNVKNAFDKLSSIDAIRQVDPLNPNEMLANDYMAAVKKGDSAIVISPTHAQCDAVSEKIRSRLKEKGMIDKKDKKAVRLTNRNLTLAQKADWKEYQPRQVIQFNQHVGKIKKGSSWKVTGISNGEVRLVDENKNRTVLPLEKAKDFEVYDFSLMKLSKGDSVRITRNGMDKEGKRLNNGMSLKVASIDKQGNIILKSKNDKGKYRINRKHGNIAHDYCITSHASQGKTVDQVFIAQPSSTFQATDMKQFYVSVSRGRYKANIYTDDKEALLDYASEAGNRQSALELTADKNSRVDFVIDTVRQEKFQQRSKTVLAKEFAKTKTSFEKEYEPGI